MDGFDFDLNELGELVVDQESHDINTIIEDELRIQMAYTRIKSIASNWYYDKIGADLEELIGKAVSQDNVQLGKDKILNVLTYDDLWDLKDIYIQSEIKDAKNIFYSVYLKVYDSETNEEQSIEIIITLDLIKGVKIKFGWE